MEKRIIRKILIETKIEGEITIKSLKEILDSFKKYGDEAKIEILEDFEEKDGKDINVTSFTLYVAELESDEEFNNRLKREENVEKILKKIRRNKYLELKKEFENE